MTYAQSTASLPWNQQDSTDLFRQYQLDHSEFIRNELMVRYMPLVKFVADQLNITLPGSASTDDMIQAGSFGLRDAIDAFDPARGVRFDTYCRPRIRGAMLDELRRLDWVPRLARQRSSAVQQISRQMEMELGHKPSTDEIFRKMGIREDDYGKMLRDSRATNQYICNHGDIGGAGRTGGELESVEDEGSKASLDAVISQDLRDYLVRGLSRAERLILTLYYYENMTMKEIGRILEMSESRVSQMHSNLLLRLRAHLAARYVDLFGLPDDHLGAA